MKKYYYERSRLLESEVNIAFEELLWMDDIQTTKWIDSLREFILREWDVYGIPPTIGQNTEMLKRNFHKLRDYILVRREPLYMERLSHCSQEVGEYMKPHVEL